MASPRAALVTGGASGIGRATVELFLERGDSVVAADFNAESGERLLSDLAGAAGDGRLVFARADVAQEADVAAAVDRATTAFGRLDWVVNNAGIGGAFGPITEIEVEDWDHTFAVLMRGVFLGVKHGARAIRAHGDGGAIVNTASVAGLSGGGGPQAYSAAKAAVVNFGRATAAELAADRIRLNTVCPGYVHTPLALGRKPPPDLSPIQPWPDAGQPRDIAEVIAFLCDDRSRFVCGAEIVADGGLLAAAPGLTRIPGNPLAVGVVGLNRGTTGERSFVRRRLDEDG